MTDSEARRRELQKIAQTQPESSLHVKVEEFLAEGADPYNLMQDLIAVAQDLGDPEQEQVFELLDRFVGRGSMSYGLFSPDKMFELLQRLNHRNASDH